MTVSQALNMIAPVRLIVTNGQVIFNTWDEEEAAYWSAQGANAREFYTETELERQRRLGTSLQQGWEVNLKGACDPVMITKLTGVVEDITSLELVKEAKKRRQEAFGG